MCGNVLQASGRFFASEHAIVVTAREGTDIGWLTLALGTLSSQSTSGILSPPVLTVSKLGIVELISPPTRQEQIATVLSDTGAELTTLETRDWESEAENFVN